ncbi:MAG: hypothetical protein V1722_02290 [Candidatus Micrarchaeota archaeon]
MQRDDDGDYEDKEGENMCAETEDSYITDKKYKCDKCGKKKTEKAGTLFAPFCCNRIMKLTHKLEHKFDFESIIKRSLEKENKLFPISKTAKAKLKAAKKAKVKAKKSKVKTKNKKPTKVKAKKLAKVKKTAKKVKVKKPKVKKAKAKKVAKQKKGKKSRK